ncbi:hypothetical protein GOP47_0016636 [Adiantum capillus-veneris]|uniref:glutamate decarboxylase n=1 Tax=Adiantum capillus-veneris TaxID=13818 RepID=A0A9D4ZD62_ADICA|nr:hypothetical protein GOP47_0016636 [Adiantum capillus-veneris]
MTNKEFQQPERGKNMLCAEYKWWFLAPFLYPELEWDFRLSCVRSINVSGHKYGLVYAGVGWVVWKSKDDLPEELIFHVNYLGADQPTFTLNFSKGASQIIAQYYQFIRLGFEGYKSIMENCRSNAKVLCDGICSTGRFNILSKDVGVPVVAFSLKDRSQHDEFEVADNLRRYGWIVPAYTMAPDAEHICLLRVVMREDFSCTLAQRLVEDIRRVLDYLDARPPKLVEAVAVAIAQKEPELKEDVKPSTLLASPVFREVMLAKNFPKKFGSFKMNGVC